MSQHNNRREFLKHSALAGAGFWAAGSFAIAQNRSPNEKLNIGIIGVHSRGAANMRSVSSENIVALCDVDQLYLAGAAEQHPKAKKYTDWRKMLEQKDIDAVQDAMENNSLLFVTSSIPGKEGSRDFDAMYKVGVVGSIMRKVHIPDGRVKILFQG